MAIIDVGAGRPIVLIPGIQGRWEWMQPAVAALAVRFRVITFSLLGERTFGGIVPIPMDFEDDQGKDGDHGRQDAKPRGLDALKRPGLRRARVL